MHRHQKLCEVSSTSKPPGIEPRTSASPSSSVLTISPPTQVTEELKDTCGICFEPFTSLCYLHPCKHRFDYECIDPWVTSLYQHSPFLSPESMTCPMCRGVIRHIEKTNPRVITDITQLFPGLNTQARESSRVSGSSRIQNYGQHNNQRLPNGHHNHSHRPTPVYRPNRTIDPVPTRTPVVYRSPIVTRWRTYYNQSFSSVPTTRWPRLHMSPATRMQPQLNGRSTDNNRPTGSLSGSNTPSRHPERNFPREVQLLRDMAQTRSRPARGWSMPDTSARSQLVRFIRTRENSRPMSRFGSQNGDARFNSGR